jgi:hypothetical protein
VNGRTRLILAGLLATLIAGCDDAAPCDAPKSQPLALAEEFDPAACGDITGCAVWEGDAPNVVPFRAPVSPFGEAANGPKRDWPNPNAPAVDPKNRRVAGAVVFLRSVDPARSRPWDLPPVRVEIRDYDYRVRQGVVESRTGFVRREDPVEIVSHQAVFHSVRARGAAFFTLAFADPEQPRERVFDRPGVVELSSAAGYFWARAHLFVAEHPYYTRTDAAGRFVLPQVPAGDYELVCWLPDWRVKDRELDSESWQVTRLTFGPPVETTQAARVLARQTTMTEITIPTTRFAP